MIYVVEDNEGIRETIKAYLELADYQVLEFDGVSNVIDSLPFKRPQLCILDVMLPDGNGFELAKNLHAKDPDIAFLFLTARESESDRITGLELGAEDYIVKPFSPRELVLRVQAILKRVSRSQGESEKTQNWELDGHALWINETTHEATLDQEAVHLTAVEWKILLFLSSNAPQLMSRERILGECLDYVHDGSDRTVNTHLKNLRSKLGGYDWIETVRFYGYRFIAHKTEV